jgi:tryptophanyl-tRNA synthetase
MKHLIRNMNTTLEPVREMRAGITAKPGFVREVLQEGGARARALASSTMQDVADAMKLL